jgi:hypothetical protein
MAGVERVVGVVGEGDEAFEVGERALVLLAPLKENAGLDDVRPQGPRQVGDRVVGGIEVSKGALGGEKQRGAADASAGEDETRRQVALDGIGVEERQAG